MRNLFAFDFDHTIIELNSDTVVASKIPGGIPENIRKIHKWTEYMQGVFATLHKFGYTKDFYRTVIEGLDPVAGMIDLIRELKTNFNCEIIIISDSNSYFINTWLVHNNLENNILKVFTNPAEFKDNLLKIEPYHFQDRCELSSENLCKGQILQDFILEQKKSGVIYNTILYAGDGANDLCPILRMKQHDHAFVRRGYRLSDLVGKVLKSDMKDKSGAYYQLQATVHHWTDASDILQNVREICGEINDS